MANQKETHQKEVSKDAKLFKVKIRTLKNTPYNIYYRMMSTMRVTIRV